MPTEAPPGFSRVDPDTLCLSCLQIGDLHGGCRVCGFDEHLPPASPLHLTPRSILHGQYLLGRVLGQGGFGITYLGWDLNLDHAVALKEYLPTDFASRTAGHSAVTPYGDAGPINFEYGLEAFEAEARTLARCYNLPGVVDVLNYFRENGTGYIVMHYLRGRTLRDQLRERATPLPFEEAVAIMQPLLVALQEVHRLGLVHRDISPDNVYMCDTGRVCLLDFGAARNAVRDRSKSLSVQFKPGYTPEEQYRRQGQQGPWTDIYAAAATMYRVMTGQPPPPALDRLQNDQLQPPSKLGVVIPREAERALLRALAVHAEQRYRSAEAFLGDLVPGGALAASGSGSGAGAGAGRRAGLPPGASASGGVVGTIGGMIVDVVRLARMKLDGALHGSGGVARERAIREQLATLWPVTLVNVQLKDPHLPAGPEHGPLDVYARDETHDVRFEVILQNNFAGIRALTGTLQPMFVNPRGVGHTMEIAVGDLRDRIALPGVWSPPQPDDLLPGTWRIDFWWDGRKIGERGFVVSV